MAAMKAHSTDRNEYNMSPRSFATAVKSSASGVPLTSANAALSGSRLSSTRDSSDADNPLPVPPGMIYTETIGHNSMLVTVLVKRWQQMLYPEWLADRVSPVGP